MLDPRLGGDGLRKLTDLLAKALPHNDELESIVERSELELAAVRSAGSVRLRWQNVLMAADFEHPERLDRLLSELEHELARSKVHRQALKAWMSVARRRAAPAVAASELFAGVAQIGDQPDPREVEHLVEAVRHALLDIRDAFEDDNVTPLSLSAKDEAEARDEIVGACRRALAAADTLLASLGIARRLLADRRPSDSEDVSFLKERNMVRALIDDREDVLAAVRRLRSLLSVRAPAILPPTDHSDEG